MRPHRHVLDVAVACLSLLVATGCRPEAPEMPGALTAAPGNGQVTLQWQPPVNEGTSGVTGYRVSTEPGGASESLEAAARTHTVTGLANGTPHTFTVHAINEAGDSPGATVTATPLTLPGGPTAAVAVAGVNAASLTWVAPVDTGGGAVTGYQITPYLGAAAQPVQVFTGTATAAQVVGLFRASTYTFTVAAQNAAGIGAPSASSNAVTTPDWPGAPTGVAGTRGNGQVALSWTAPASNGGSPITGYLITPYVGAAVGTPTTSSGAGTSATVSGLTNGTAYTFRVSAINAVGMGPQSTASGAVTPADVPGAPLAVTARAGNGQATVGWTAPNPDGSPITSYTVTVSPGGGTATSATPGLTFPGLTNGQTYSFTVTATNSVGEGPSSASSLSVIPGPVPPDCAGALLQNPATASGVFSIQVQSSALDVYCDMTTDGGGWTMVYKLSSGVAGDAAALWNAAAPQNESLPAFLSVTPSAAHYLSRIVTDYWNTSGVAWTQARVAVFDGGTEEAFVKLNATASSRTSWFALANVTASTWTDLADGQNFFGIDGDWAVLRNWFINHAYDACGGDVGWLVVDIGGAACTWEIAPGAPVRILYAPGPLRTNWTTSAGIADVLAVFVR